MLHNNRRWCVSRLTEPEDLARMLVDFTWTGRQAFELGAYLFLNDSTSGDGAQEYAIVRPSASDGGPYWQIESITFGWTTFEKALEYVREILAGTYDTAEYRREVWPQLETHEVHGTCHLCA